METNETEWEYICKVGVYSVYTHKWGRLNWGHKIQRDDSISKNSGFYFKITAIIAAKKRARQKIKEREKFTPMYILGLLAKKS
jgi:hypothetical protein